MIRVFLLFHSHVLFRRQMSGERLANHFISPLCAQTQYKLHKPHSDHPLVHIMPKKGKNQRHRHLKSLPRKSTASNSWRSLLKSFNLNCPSFRFGVKSLVKSSPCVCSYKVDTAVNGVYPMEATFPPWHRNTLMLALLSNMSRPGRKANWGNWENIKEEKLKTLNRPLHILATARNNTKANNSCLVLWCNHTSN